MFRYSRDVKRCGPGTKAGAPVGVVYCLSTSSFFILKLTLGLDVSAFRCGDPHIRGVPHRPAVRTFGPVPASRIVAKSRPRPEDGPVNFSRVAARPVDARPG